MVNPIKIIKGVTKAVTTGKAKANKKAALKSGLENRGAKLTKAQAIDRAAEYKWNKMESYMDQRFDTMAGGPRAGGSSVGKPGKTNTRKAAAINRLANQKPPVKAAKVPIKKKAGNK